MHTIKMKSENDWQVGRIVTNCGVESFLAMFHGMSVVSAIRLCNTLNGGEVNIDDLYAKVLPSLVVK